MPGPGNRAKAAKARKNKSAAAPARPRDPYLADVDDADGWTPIVNILCSCFELPDLTTRKGLKKVHANFDAIYRKLDTAYQKNPDNERVRGGIVGIYAKMCVDSLLRDKLYDKGLLDKLFPLLQVDSTRYMALRALTTITHHGGSTTRSSIAARSSSLTSLVDAYPSDPLVCDLVTSVLSHSVLALTEGPEGSPAYPQILAKIDMVKVLQTVMHCMTQPFSTRSTIDHGTELLASSTLHATLAHRAVPQTAAWLVAGLRSPDWCTRCLSLGGLFRLHKLGAEEDLRAIDPQRLIGAIMSIPDELKDVMMDYGLMNCDLYKTMQCTRDFQKAIMQVPQDRDMYAFGMKLYNLILTTEFSISDGYYETINERTGKREILDVGVPFKRYSDALPLCAKVIREKHSSASAKGNAKQDQAALDAANVLELKHKIMTRQLPLASTIANAALASNPNFPYYYYAISLCADHSSGLRASKKGLKCPSINSSPFVKFQLMQRAVEHAGEMGLDVLAGMPEKGERKWEEGIAFLVSALEDAKTFIEEAPPDNRYMKNVCYWYVLLTIVISENISSDLREVKKGLDRLKIADKFSTIIDTKPPRTMLRQTQATVVSLFSSSIAKYSAFFECGKTVQPSVESEADQKVKDDLAAWLDNMHLEEGEKEPDVAHVHPRISSNQVDLYRCSHCGNPSAALRKCSGCEKARYVSLPTLALGSTRF
ncbi:hypothetical protein MD484_g7504, partial [Candolleomyces efflorescens]